MVSDYPPLLVFRDDRSSLQGLKFAPWCLDYWADPSQADQAVLSIGDIGGQVRTADREDGCMSGPVGTLTACVFSQVSVLYFTSANTSLFERLSQRKDSDSASAILWDDLVRGRHRSCYTVTHQGHAPAWVRKGGSPQLYYQL